MQFKRSWQLGDPGTPVDKLYDRLRKRLNQKLVRYLSAQIDESPDAFVMEAGSGPAYASSLFTKVPGVRMSVALDIDLQALHEARRRDPGLALVVGDLLHMPFAPNTFDLVWNSSTLEHIGDPVPGIREMARLVKTGGKVFIGVPYVRGPLGFQRWIQHTSIGIWIGEVFDKDQIHDLILHCGLSMPVFINYFFYFFIGAIATKQAPDKPSF